MKYTEDLVIRSQEIIKQVKAAEKLKQPINNLVKEQIAIMECQKDEFIKRANEIGLDNLGRAQVEIELNSKIKQWAQKIGLPTEKYDNEIRKIRVKFLGEEFVDKNF